MTDVQCGAVWCLVRFAPAAFVRRDPLPELRCWGTRNSFSCATPGQRSARQRCALARPEMALLDPRALPEVLGEVVTPGVRVATLLNRRCRTHHRPLARTPLTHRQHPRSLCAVAGCNSAQQGTARTAPPSPPSRPRSGSRMTRARTQACLALSSGPPTTCAEEAPDHPPLTPQGRWAACSSSARRDVSPSRASPPSSSRAVPARRPTTANAHTTHLCATTDAHARAHRHPRSSEPSGRFETWGRGHRGELTSIAPVVARWSAASPACHAPQFVVLSCLVCGSVVRLRARRAACSRPAPVRRRLERVFWSAQGQGGGAARIVAMGAPAHWPVTGQESSPFVNYMPCVKLQRITTTRNPRDGGRINDRPAE